MAYNRNYLLAKVQLSNGTTEWTYRDTVDLLTFAAANYLTDLVEMGAKVGDTIEYLQVDNQATPTTVKLRATVTVLSVTRPLTGLVSGDAYTVSQPVSNTTATALTLSLGVSGKFTVNSAAPIAISLPAALGSGAQFELYVETAATATAHTIKAAGSDVMQGVDWAATTSSNAVLGYIPTATDNTISLNGTTKGGVAGDKIVLVDVAAGVWNVQAFMKPTGSTTTPFSHT